MRKVALKGKTLLDKVKRFIRLLYLKFFRINDSPQRIAFGLGLGIFLGILPGTGPIAALFLSLLFRVNRAAALLGCILTNTWLSVIAFLLSVKTGAFLLGLRWQDVYALYKELLKNFHFSDLLKVSILQTMLPVVLGYFVIGVVFAVCSYLIAILILFKIKTRHLKKKI